MINKSFVYPYPKNSKQFIDWCFSTNSRKNIFVNLGQPSPFDVSLRDGLQGLSKEEQSTYSIEKKKDLYKMIRYKHHPSNIEIGSIVSEKILPVLSDSIELLNYTNEYVKTTPDGSHNPLHFMLIPNMKKLHVALKVPLINNFSFITSVSNSFQLKNTNKTLKQTKEELHNMCCILDDSTNENYKIKLYISCINECPIEGKFDNDYVVREILQYNKLNVDNICLSDTCGTLGADDFEYIVDTCNIFGVPFSKMSLHLHVPNERKPIVKKIIRKALNRKITNFDVSFLESGGCSVTMEKSRLAPNLSYDFYYECIIDYIESKVDD